MQGVTVDHAGCRSVTVDELSADTGDGQVCGMPQHLSCRLVRATAVRHRPVPAPDRPRLVAERRQQLAWWAARFGHLWRDAITPADVRAALAKLRRTHAASTCNHDRHALSLYRGLDGRDAPNPVRDVKPFTKPAARSERPLLRRGPAHPCGDVGSGQRMVKKSHGRLRPPRRLAAASWRSPGCGPAS